MNCRQKGRRSFYLRCSPNMNLMPLSHPALHSFRILLFPDGLDTGSDLLSPVAAAEIVVIVRNRLQFPVLSLDTLVGLVQRSVPLLEAVVISCQAIEMVLDVKILAEQTPQYFDDPLIERFGPKTKPNLAEVEEAEQALDCAALIEEAVKGVEHVKIS